MLRCGRRAPSSFVPVATAAAVAEDDVGVELEVEAEVVREGVEAVEVGVTVDVDVLLKRHSREAVRRRGVRERNTESMAKEGEVVGGLSIPPRASRRS